VCTDVGMSGASTVVATPLLPVAEGALGYLLSPIGGAVRMRDRAREPRPPSAISDHGSVRTIRLPTTKTHSRPLMVTPRFLAPRAPAQEVLFLSGAAR